MTSCLDENRKCSIIHQENSPILWRIVGVFTIDGLTYTKLVSDDSIGKYSWDNKEDNDKKGINEWSTSSLKQLLNEKDYYQKINDFAENGLENNKIITELNWQLGSISEEDMPNLKANDWYNNEHNDHLETCDFGKYCTDTLERTSKVNSKVGLLYPSDIMFSTNCSDKTTKEWDKTCESYLTINKPNYWLMTPITSTNSKAYATTYQNNSGFTASFVANEAHIFPVIYLKHTIKIKGGHGTIEKPFLIS